jgi:cob(I)alamin adenosyltransferase
MDAMPTKPAPPPFRGLVQVYTGNGKGKTTAALGLALRAAGHGMRTFIGQFLKGQPTGELAAVRRLSPLVRIEQFGRTGFIQVTDGPDDADVDMARAGLRRCREVLSSGEYAIVVMDEVNTAVHFNLLAEREVLDVLDEKPAGVEVVLTGRYAPQAFVDRADLVTEMREVKHYSDRGVKAREGIER